MLERSITKRLEEELARIPVVALLGARQVGKTTFAEAVTGDMDAVYLNLELEEDVRMLDDAVGFLQKYSDRLVVLDEIQHFPKIFEVLQDLPGCGRTAEQKPGRFLLIGSTSKEHLSRSAAGLGENIGYVELSGLNALEVRGTKNNIWKLWLRGHCPGSYFSGSDILAADWLEQLIDPHLENDIQQMSPRLPPCYLRELLTALAPLQGGFIKHTQLAESLGIHYSSVNPHIGILVNLLLVRQLPPLLIESAKQLAKKPRYYIRDSGILHRMLEINSQRSLLSSPILEKSWEGFVIENIHSILPHNAETYFYSTRDGASVDLVIKMPSSEIWGIETAYGDDPSHSPRFNAACDDIGATHKYLVYSGRDEFRVNRDIRGISLPKIMEKLQSAD